MRSLVVAASLLAVCPAAAQEPSAVYQQPKKVRFTLEAIARYEWTRDIFVSPTATREEERFVGWALPGLEVNLDKLQLGVSGGFYWSDEKNYDPIPAPLRDNFRSRDARVDRAFAKFETSHIRVQGGRFTMPIAFTEMIWDKELRPQGGALRLGVSDRGSLKTAGITGLYATGSHVFEDDTDVIAVSADATFATGTEGSVELIGSYVEFQDLETVQPFLRRQNSRATPGGLLGLEYKVLDGVLRIRRGGTVPLQLVANYCYNTAADDDNRGLWLAAAVGSIRSSRARLDYTYAKVDKDATLAEYTTDDFFWGTGWEGHRGDLGFRLQQNTSLHGVAQWQRFKDSARLEERDHWVKRFRVELRFAN
jgi:Putative porin